MSKYLKAATGVAGVLVGVLVAVSGVLPEAYRPYAAVVVALATAVGVYHAPYVPSGKLDAAG